MQTDKIPALLDSVLDAYVNLTDPARPDVLLRDAELISAAEAAIGIVKANMPAAGPGSSGPTASSFVAACTSEARSCPCLFTCFFYSW